MLLSLAAGAVLDTRGPATVLAASAAGFPLTGIWVEAGELDSAATRATRSALDETGVRVLDVEVVRLGDGTDATAWQPCIEVGGALGARAVLCVGTAADRAATVHAFGLVCEAADAVGMRAVLEPMLFMTVRTLDEAVSVVTEVDHRAGGVLVDALHLTRWGGTPTDVAAVDPALRPYAQLCDGPAAGPSPDDVRGLVHEALDLRTCPGEGEMPVAELAAAYPPGTPFSLEIRSADLIERFPDPVERSRHIFTLTSAWAATVP
jgi:sugar phosphate isomerase/epimerase